MPKLTKRLIDGVAPAPRDQFLWDSELPGFGIRIWPSGRRTFVLKYRVGDGGRSARTRRPAIGTYGALTVDEARKIAREWLARVAKGGDPSGERQARRVAPTIADLAERYMREHALIHKKPSSAREDRRNLDNHLVPLLGRMRVADVTREGVQRMVREVAGGRTARDEKTGKHGRRIVRGGGIAANRCLALLSSMMTFGETWGWRADGTNPCRRVTRFAERRRERFLGREELARLGAVLAAIDAERSAPPSVTSAIRLLLLTGCRLGEVLGLRWENVDLERGLLHLPDSKTGAKTIVLTAPAMAVLTGINRVPGHAHVLAGRRAGQPLRNLQDAWQRIRRRAGLPDVRLHDLRHSYASAAAGLGIGLPIIGKLLGHAQPSTTARYAHLADDPLRRAANEVGQALASMLFPVGTEGVDERHAASAPNRPA